MSNPGSLAGRSALQKVQGEERSSTDQDRLQPRQRHHRCSPPPAIPGDALPRGRRDLRLSWRRRMASATILHERPGGCSPKVADFCGFPAILLPHLPWWGDLSLRLAAPSSTGNSGPRARNPACTGLEITTGFF